ncbi:MAG: hypothetical protein HYY04_15805 [Chloroflexi bacterium]|nr:hypothetical protein [Chloroflexota bacterium]
MAVPFATQQLIRLVTEKVIENVMRQVPRALPSGPEVSPSGVPVDAAEFSRLVRYVGALEEDLKQLNSRSEALEAKIARLERRWSWRTMFRVVVAVAVSFVLGAAVTFAAHLGGWY